MEIWKSVDGYEGKYEVSNLGRVKSLARKSKSKNYERTVRERVLKQHKAKNGYFDVMIYKDGNCKRHSVHRLVAIAFISNPQGFEFVNHKDECKTNNNAENLEWCTRKYNMNYGTVNKRISISKTKNHKIR